MSYLLKTKVLTILAFLAGLFILSYISCNKGDTSSKTVVKCVTCANGGLCINDSCQCPSGYEGISCETLSIQKFFDPWSVSEKGSASSFSQNYTLEIEQNPGSATTVFIDGLYDNFSTGGVIANVVGDTLYIPNQTTSNGYTFVGVGYIHSDPQFGADGAITMRYQVINSSIGLNNDFGYSSPNDSPSQWRKD